MKSGGGEENSWTQQEAEGMSGAIFTAIEQHVGKEKYRFLKC